MRGWIYIADNESLSDMIKIGYSDQDPKLRMESLSNTSVPTPFRLLYEALVDSPFEVEQYLHRVFASERVANNREFFCVSARQVVEEMLRYFEDIGASVYIENWYIDEEGQGYRCTRSTFDDLVRKFRNGVFYDLTLYREWLIEEQRLSVIENDTFLKSIPNGFKRISSVFAATNKKWSHRQSLLEESLNFALGQELLSKKFQEICRLNFDSVDEIEEYLMRFFREQFFYKFTWFGDMSRDSNGDFQEHNFMCRSCKEFGTSEDFDLILNSFNQAAKKFGIPFTLSTMSICSIEDIAAHTQAPFWFQLYMMRDREAMARMIDRCKAANVSAMVLTLDLQVIGQRHKDLKNGLTAPPSPTFTNIINLMTKPRWCLGMAGTRRHTFGNLVGHVKAVSNMKSLASWTNEQFDPTLNWEDVAWVKKQWGGKLILKGIMDTEDAKLAVASGADAIVVSNHGGRQLDGAPSSIEALPAIVAAVGDQIEVWMDGGIRSGQDVLKAWALGAKGTMIGRAMVYGLGAMGEAGVTKALQIIHKELDVTMAFCGHTNIQNVNSNILLPGTFPRALSSL